MALIATIIGKESTVHSPTVVSDQGKFMIEMRSSHRSPRYYIWVTSKRITESPGVRETKPPSVLFQPAEHLKLRDLGTLAALPLLGVIKSDLAGIVT
jgi:hypothetical protein